MANCASPIVTLKGNQAFTNSRDVAEFFGKEHFNVLRAIRAFDMPSNVMASLFSFRSAPDAYGRMADTFDMTKDSFTLLAIGFTGAKALQFKLAYIAAFNELEAKANAAVEKLDGFGQKRLPPTVGAPGVITYIGMPVAIIFPGGRPRWFVGLPRHLSTAIVFRQKCETARSNRKQSVTPVAPLSVTIHS